MTLGKPVAGVCAATALFVCGVTGFPVAPDSVPASTGTLSLGGTATTSLVAGQDLSLIADGFASNASISIVQYSEPTTLGTTVADSSGHMSVEVSLDPDLTGQHTLVALGNAPDGSAHAVESRVTIAAPATSPIGASELARTGFSTAAYAGGGFLALLSGIALIRAARGRKTLPVA